MVNISREATNKLLAAASLLSEKKKEKNSGVRNTQQNRIENKNNDTGGHLGGKPQLGRNYPAPSNGRRRDRLTKVADWRGYLVAVACIHNQPHSSISALKQHLLCEHTVIVKGTQAVNYIGLETRTATEAENRLRDKTAFAGGTTTKYLPYNFLQRDYKEEICPCPLHRFRPFHPLSKIDRLMRLLFSHPCPQILFVNQNKTTTTAADTTATKSPPLISLILS